MRTILAFLLIPLLGATPYNPSKHQFGYAVENDPDLCIAYRLWKSRQFEFGKKQVTTNSIGFRDREWKETKPSGTFRILGLGDSVMMGYGVADDEPYLRRLETLLKKRNPGKPIEVMNLGVFGYNTIQELQVLRKIGLNFGPDLIVLGYVGNDVEGDNTRDCSESVMVRGFRRLRRRGLSFIYRKLGRVNPELKQIQREDLKDFKTAFSEIGELARSRNIPVILVLDSRYESPLIPHGEVEKMGSSLSMIPLNLLSKLHSNILGLRPEQAGSQKDAHNRTYLIDYFPGNAHPNAAWHQRTAELLRDLIFQKGLLKVPSQNPSPDK